MCGSLLKPSISLDGVDFESNLYSVDHFVEKFIQKQRNGFYVCAVDGFKLSSRFTARIHASKYHMSEIDQCDCLERVSFANAAEDDNIDPIHEESSAIVLDDDNLYLLSTKSRALIKSRRKKIDSFMSIPLPVATSSAETDYCLHSGLTNSTLQPHQVQGLHWLLSMYHQDLNCILADDMGRGKTIQTLALFSRLQFPIDSSLTHFSFSNAEWTGPHLILLPLSVMSSWKSEIITRFPRSIVLEYNFKSDQEKGNFYRIDRLRRLMLMALWSRRLTSSFLDKFAGPLIVLMTFDLFIRDYDSILLMMKDLTDLSC